MRSDSFKADPLDILYLLSAIIIFHTYSFTLFLNLKKIGLVKKYLKEENYNKNHKL